MPSVLENDLPRSDWLGGSPHSQEETCPRWFRPDGDRLPVCIPNVATAFGITPAARDTTIVFDRWMFVGSPIRWLILPPGGRTGWELFLCRCLFNRSAEQAAPRRGRILM